VGRYRHEKGPPGVSSSGPSRAQNLLDLKHGSAPVFLSLAAARGCCELQKSVPPEDKRAGVMMYRVGKPSTS
jgi:hypothetical protein